MLPAIPRDSIEGPEAMAERKRSKREELAYAELQGRDTYARDWWASRGARTTEDLSSWQFDCRQDLERVLRMEFPRDQADAWLSAG